MNAQTILALVLLLPNVLAAQPGKPRADLHGDPLPEGVLARLGTVRLRPGEPEFRIAVSPDGKTLATAEAQTLRFWDLASGKETRAVEIRQAIGVFSVGYSPDGKHCV